MKLTLSIVSAGLVALAAACGGSGGGSLFNDGGGSPDPGFVVESVLPAQGDVWQVNRPIEIVFSKKVNPATVSPASIAIQEVGTNAPAFGTYSLVNGVKVVFQPTCPTTTQAPGLKFGSQYQIVIPSSSNPGASTVASQEGHTLNAGKTIAFSTPAQGSPGAFYDPQVNQAPTLVSPNGSTFTVTQNDGTTITTAFGASASIPVNKFVGPSVYFTLLFNQPVSPSASNISSQVLRILFEQPAGSGTYVAMPTAVTLVNNCTATGAEVRLAPLGLLPGGRKLRILITQSFTDLGGEVSLFDTVLPLGGGEPVVQNPSPTGDFDAIIEDFTTDANEDPNPGFGDPTAVWPSSGNLEAAFAFGGQQSSLDLVINGITQVDTSLTTLGGQVFSGGNIFLRTLTVNAGATMLGQGPNPLRIFVTDSVSISGSITANGIDGPDVTGLGTLAFPSQGGPGQCGGGEGGDGNPITSSSTPIGAPGNGAFNSPGGGGRGGESALLADLQCANELAPNHPAGGGGGSYGTVGERGSDGAPFAAPFFTGTCQKPAHGAIGGTNLNAQGGQPGPPTFTNAEQTDNYFGTTLVRKGVTSTATSISTTSTKIVFASGSVSSADVGRYAAFYKTGSNFWETNPCGTAPQDPTQCVRSQLQVRKISAVGATNADFTVVPALPTVPLGGETWAIFGTGTTQKGELVQALGGQGGGGGGNYVDSITFPNPNFLNNDKRGAGGGGGGGVIEIQCLGPISLSLSAIVSANGGKGGAGENVNAGNQRLGGGSGGGSGGTVILQSAAGITMASSVSVLARGGKRGPGQSEVDTPPVIPTDPKGLGYGGRGGKGVVQLHTPFVNGVPGVTFSGFTPTTGPELGKSICDPAPIFAVPTFGSVSRARSIWFDTGATAIVTPGQPTYSFEGIDLVTNPGAILTTVGGSVQPLTEIAGTDAAGGDAPIAASAVGVNSLTLPLTVFTSPAVLGEPRTLLRNRVIVGSNQGSVIGVTSSPPNVILTTDNTATSPLNAGLAAGATNTWHVIPRYFEAASATTGGIQTDVVSPSARVTILFQGTNANASGAPDTTAIVPDPASLPFGTPDMTLLTAKRFIRFNVGFDLNTGAAPPLQLSAQSPRPRLNFLKIPFQFSP